MQCYIRFYQPSAGIRCRNYRRRQRCQEAKVGCRGEYGIARATGPHDLKEPDGEPDLPRAGGWETVVRRLRISGTTQPLQTTISLFYERRREILTRPYLF